MSDEQAPAPKVIGINGKPHEVTADTSAKVRQSLEWAMSNFDGEKHVAVGVVIVDHMGRVGTSFYWETGFSHNLISAAALLQSRAIAHFEQQQKEDT